MDKSAFLFDKIDFSFIHTNYMSVIALNHVKLTPTSVHYMWLASFILASSSYSTQYTFMPTFANSLISFKAKAEWVKPLRAINITFVILLYLRVFRAFILISVDYSIDDSFIKILEISIATLPLPMITTFFVF